MDPRTGDIYGPSDLDRLRQEERDRLLPISGELAHVMREGNRATRRRVARQVRRAQRREGR